MTTTPFSFVWSFETDDRDALLRSRTTFGAVLRAFAQTSDGVAAAEAIYGELASVAATHGATPFRVEVDWTSERPQLTVRDAGPRGGQHQRRMNVAARLAERFAIDADADGVAAIATLPVRRSAA